MAHRTDVEVEADEVRRLRLLEALAEDADVRQVDLAERLGVAVGTVNWLLKRLTRKGYVKAKRVGQWRWRYLLTPAGFAEKTRLTRRYIQSSMELYRATRRRARELLGELRERGYRSVQVEGEPGNDLVDVCRLTCLELEMAVTDEPSQPMLKVVGRELELAWPSEEGQRHAPQDCRSEDDEKLDEVIRRIVEVADPEKIILFGSAARGERGPNSDVDLLVVKSDVHRRHLARRIYRHLIGVGQAVDIVVATPEDLRRYGASIGLIYRSALREGEVVYERTPQIAG